MQHITADREALKTKTLITLTAIAWAAGLVLAGSEGPWMPYLNGLGALVFLVASLALGRLLPRLENRAAMAMARPLPKTGERAAVSLARGENRSFQNTSRIRNAAGISGRKIAPRYARELGIV